MRKLLAELEASDPSVRQRAVQGIASMGEAAAPALDRLLKLLADNDQGVRYEAAYAITCLGPSASVAIEPLRRIFLNESEAMAIRERAALSIAQLGPAGLPVLMSCLDSRMTNSVRTSAANCIGYFGETASPAVALLVELLGDEDSRLVRSASESLVAVGPKAVTELHRALASDFERLRVNSASVLIRIQKLDSLAVECLSRALASTEPSHRRRALEGLSHADSSFDTIVVDNIIKSLRDPDPQITYAAARTLSVFGAKAGHAVPELIRLLEDPYLFTRTYAAFALGKIGEQAAAAVPKLCDRLLFDDENMALFVLHALEDIGKAAIGAERTIEEKLKQKGLSKEVRSEGRRTLKALRMLR